MIPSNLWAIRETDYSLKIKENDTYEWEITFVNETIYQLLNYKTVGLIFDLGAKIKVIVKKIHSYPAGWDLECEVQGVDPFELSLYTYRRYSVKKFPSESSESLILNAGVDRATIFGATPINTYLSEFSAKHSNMIANGTTVISYHGLGARSSNYLYRVEGEFNENSGVQTSVKYFLDTDELIYQYDLILQPSIPGYTLPGFLFLIGIAIVGLVIFIKNNISRN